MEKWIMEVFYQGVNQSEHEAEKTSGVVLRMSVVSFPQCCTALTAKYVNG